MSQFLRDFLPTFTFQNKVYFDRTLPKGAFSSVRVSETFSKAIQWILQNKFGDFHVSHIIDDFIFVGPGGSDQCDTCLNFV